MIIDLKEQFPHLKNAPIVEAIIDIRFVSQVKWEDQLLRTELTKVLADYPKVETVRESRFQFSIEKEGSPAIEDLGIFGLKFQSNFKPHIVQFNKNQFVFSRLKPYESWSTFKQEALRLWGVYARLLQPTDVSRIGVRFINRMAVLKEKVELADFYKISPQPLPGAMDWPLTEFLYRDVIQVPTTPYFVNLIKTVQRSHTLQEIGLILDIDVIMQKRFDFDNNHLEKCLEEMRWVKNKIFYSSITEKVIQEMT